MHINFKPIKNIFKPWKSLHVFFALLTCEKDMLTEYTLNLFMIHDFYLIQQFLSAKITNRRARAIIRGFMPPCRNYCHFDFSSHYPMLGLSIKTFNYHQSDPLYFMYRVIIIIFYGYCRILITTKESAPVCFSFCFIEQASYPTIILRIMIQDR